MSYANSDIVCVGDLMIERMVDVNSLPARGTTLIVDSSHPQVGGPAFNLCWYLKHLGLSPRLVGLFGSQNTLLICDAFKTARLDRSGLMSVQGSTDFLVAMLTGETHHSLYFRNHLPTSSKNWIRSRCKHAKRLVITGSRHSITRKAFLSLATDFQGDLLVFNPSYAITEYEINELRALLLSANVTVMNEEEAEHACKTLKLKSRARLFDFVSNTLIVTLGKHGIELRDNERAVKLPGYSKPTKRNAHKIGAGDAFLAGFLFETFQGRQVFDSVRYGLALAAEVVESPLVRASVSDRKVRERIARGTDRNAIQYV